MDDWGSISSRGSEGNFFSSPPRSDRLWSPASLLSKGYWGPFPRLKRPGREADHSLPSSVEVKNAWSYTSTPQYVFMEWYLVKHKDNYPYRSVRMDQYFLRPNWYRSHQEVSELYSEIYSSEWNKRTKVADFCYELLSSYIFYLSV
jgi:hypothetical protein